jgi:hypothetical protein
VRLQRHTYTPSGRGAGGAVAVADADTDVFADANENDDAVVGAGFMSTSDSRETPIHYIKVAIIVLCFGARCLMLSSVSLLCTQGGLGVLFVLHCKEQDGATGALHIGAVVSELSQVSA